MAIQQQGGEQGEPVDPRLSILDYPQKKLVLLCDSLFDLVSEVDAGMRSGGGMRKNFDDLIVVHNNIYNRTKKLMDKEELEKFKPMMKERPEQVMSKVKEFLEFLQNEGIYPIGNEEPKI